MKANLNDMDERVITGYSDTDGEGFYVGKKPPVAAGDIVKEILYHTPEGHGDRHFVDVYFEDGTVMRDFDVSFVMFE